MNIDLSILSRGGLLATLGIELVELTRERVTATMPVTAALHQPFGYMHGGASVSLAETVASVGANMNCPPGKAAFGLEINANHVRPVRDGMLTAVGLPAHIGRTSQVWQITIYDEHGRTVCLSRCTLAHIDLIADNR